MKKKSQNKMSENNNFVHFCKVFVMLYDSTQKASNVIKVHRLTYIPGLGVDLVIKKLYVICYIKRRILISYHGA